jgi:O-antigen/teichoic acid export membrane protein
VSGTFVGKRHLGGELAKPDSLSTYLQGARLAFVLLVASAGLRYFTQVVLARLLGANDYGVLIYLISIVEILALISGFGLSAAALRYIPQYREEGNQLELTSYVIFSRRTVLGLSLLVAGTAYLALHLGFLPARMADHKVLFQRGMLLVPFSALILLYTDLGRGAKKIFLAYFPSLIVRQLVIVGVAGFALVANNSVSSSYMVNVILGAVILVLLMQSLWFAKSIPLQKCKVSVNESLKKWGSVAFFLLLVNLLMTVFPQIDILLLGSLVDSDQVGRYAAASKTAMLAGFPLLAIVSAMAPLISEYYTQKKTKDLQLALKKAARMAVSGTALILFILVVGGRHILALFGKSFTDAYFELALLSLSHFVAASFGLVFYLLNLTGNQKVSVLIFGIVIILDVILNLTLIPLWGTKGAAFSTFSAVIVLHFAHYWYARYKLKLSSFLF